MKNTSKLSLAAIAASLTLVGCGGGGTDAGAPSNLVSVSNAPIYNAYVTDANGQVAYQVPGTYQYKFASEPTYPISASKGWMDVNLNRTRDAGDVELGYIMTSYSNTVTPVTTYIADADESVREARLQELSDEFNISTEILLDIPVELAVSEETQKLAILAASLTEEQVVNGSMDLTAVSTTFNDTVSNYTFDNTDMTTFIKDLENTVVTPLITNGDLTVADASSDVPAAIAAVEGNALEIAISSTDIQRVFFGRNRTVNMHSTDYQASDWRDQFSDWSYDESTGNILIHMSPSETVTIHFDVLPVIEGTVDSSSIVQNGKGSITIPGEGTFDFTVDTGYVGLWGDRSNFDFNATTLEGKSLTFAPNTNDIYTMSITSFVKQIAFTSATEAAVVIVGDTGALDEVTVGWELINGNIVRIDPRDGDEYIYLEIIDNDANEVFGYFYMTGDPGMDAHVYSGLGMFNPIIDTTTSTGTPTDTNTSTSTVTTTTDTTTSTTTTSTQPTLRELLAGQTLYNDTNYEAWEFNADVTSIYWYDVDYITLDSTNSGTYDIVLSGNTITAGNEDVLAEIFDKYITLTWPNGTKENLWYNLAEMEAAIGTTTSTGTSTSTAPTIDYSMFFGKHIEFTGYAGKFDFTSTPEAVGYRGTYYKEDGTTVTMMWSINQANELRISLLNANMFWEDIASFNFPEGLNPGAVVEFWDLVNDSVADITISVFN